MSANGFCFKHGLDPEFMGKLETLAKRPGWFADVLADAELVLGIRNNYINVYWRGCSLFKIDRDGKSGALRFSTHPKYLLNADLSAPVALVPESGEWKFTLNAIEALRNRYEGPETLAGMKQAAKYYAGAEKKGLHPIICDLDNNVIDTEITFDRQGQSEGERRSTQRVDIACLEEVESSIRLRFWEAKLYENDELWRGKDNVIDQVTRYREKLEEHRDEVLNSYRLVAKNLHEIAQWSGGSRNIGALVQEVAKEKRPLVLDDTPFIGLIVFGFDEAQKKSERWEKRRQKLEQELFQRPSGHRRGLIPRGDPKGLRLRAGPALSSSAVGA